MCLQNCQCSVPFSCLELDLGRFCTYLEMEEEKSEQSEVSSTLVVWIDVKKRNATLIISCQFKCRAFYALFFWENTCSTAPHNHVKCHTGKPAKDVAMVQILSKQPSKTFSFSKVKPAIIFMALFRFFFFFLFVHLHQEFTKKIDLL